jgi:dihydroxy-acid dehydratase
MSSDQPVSTFVSSNPGRDVQRVGTAAFLGEDVEKIHDPVWAVIGNLGDSQCYLGVPEKVQTIQAALSRRIAQEDLPVRLIPPAFTLGVSDGQLNGTPQMRFSLIGRELVHDVADVHLAANSVAGLVAVVACDKPPVGTSSRTTRRRSFSRTGRSGRGPTPRQVRGSIWCRLSRWPIRTPRSAPATP